MGLTIFHGILSILQNTGLDLNNVVYLLLDFFVFVFHLAHDIIQIRNNVMWD